MQGSYFDSLGKLLIFLGVLLLIIGSIIHFGGKLFSLGRLPGDIRIERENFSFYFPVMSSIILSIIVTILLNIFSRK